MYTYKAVQCNIPNSMAIVMEFDCLCWELVSVVKQSDFIYIYWFKKHI